MHLREPPTDLIKQLHHQQRLERRLNPSPRDLERQKEMEMFGAQLGAPVPARDNSRDMRDRDRDRRR